MTWGGDYRLRGFYIDNLTDRDDDAQDSAAYYSSRFLLTAAAKDENVSGVVKLIASRTDGNGNRLLGGNPTGSPAGAGGIYGPEATSDVGILEAYLKADFDGWNFTGGRKVYKLGHGIILDDAVDGLWADFNFGSTVLTLATLKLIEKTEIGLVGIGNSGTPGSGGDADLYVANYALGNMLGGMHTDVFFAYLTDREADLFGGGGPGNADDDATLWTAGVMYGGLVGSLHLHGELDYLSGEVTVGGTKTDLEGLNLAIGGKTDVGPVPIGVDLIYASGQDPGSTSEVNVNGLNGNYPIGIILTNTGARSLDTKDGTCLSVDGGSLGGSLGCIAGSGLMVAKLSSGFTHERHVIDVAAIYARSVEEPVVGGDTDIGIELDATLTMALTKRLSFLAGIGYMLPGDFFKFGVPAAATDDMIVGVLQTSFTF
jgi:hypothetical protein